jgi:glycosyltransferase involved in cell wall biosynthesis
MKIVFYSPYLPHHFGGGEKYLLDVALTYATKHRVYIAISRSYQPEDLEQIKAQYQDFFDVDLSALTFITTPLGCRGRRWAKLWWTGNFNCLYYVTDGSAFFSLARRNIMHIQVPLPLPAKKFWERRKFACFKKINTNSYFTRKVVERYWGIKVTAVCQPGVETARLAPVGVKKEKIILSVGRFFSNLHSKRQDVLVDLFRQLRAREPALLRGWRLVLVGKVEDQAYFKQVQALTKGLPVTIITDASREQLLTYYQKSSLYWHATGFGVDEARHPEKTEHFGISTVEAMAAGCVPIIIDRGGQREILGQHLRSWAWELPADCLRLTKKALKDESLRLRVGQLAQKRAREYDLAVFAKKQWKMLT